MKRLITTLFLSCVAGLITATTDAQDIDSWTPQNLKARFGEVHLKSVDRKIKVVTFGPTRHFHADLCFSLILEIMRGPIFIPDPNAEDSYPGVEVTGDYSIWIDHKTNITIDQLQGFVFVAVKSADATKPAYSDGSVVLTAHLVDDEQGEWFVVEVR